MHTPAHTLKDRAIVLCVGGGIAAYKSVELLRTLTNEGAQVRVVMTRSAQKFVGALTFRTLSGQAVFTDMFDSEQDADIGHIRVADGADLIIVAPATANLMARLVAGMADDPVTAAVLASRCPVLLAPAMNVNMWESEATRANVATLVERGVQFVGPEHGFLACKWTGAGRLSEPADIAEAAACVLSPDDFASLRVVVSAGGTQEAIDPVRFIGNRSSGKMGFAIARAAVRRGARVRLISGPTSFENRTGAELVAVRSAADMAAAVHKASRDADLVVMAAAVADYRPASVASEKLKKAAWGDAPAIGLERTEDILAVLGAARKGVRPYLVGFAAETENIEASARGKRITKGCDLIVANDVSQGDRGFGSDQNAAELYWEGGAESLALASKESIAHSILDRALANMASGEARGHAL